MVLQDKATDKKTLKKRGKGLLEMATIFEKVGKKYEKEQEKAGMAGAAFFGAEPQHAKPSAAKPAAAAAANGRSSTGKETKKEEPETNISPRDKPLPKVR